MECKGRLLTEEQMDELSFMVHNYYNKDISICSCDVERVLTTNRKEYQPVRVQNDPLLIIEVQDMNSVPSVTYKGEDIKGKVSIGYEWETGGFEKKSKQIIKINHVYHEDNLLVEKTIQEVTI